MSSEAGGYSGIKTVAFTISVSILILASLYLARCCSGLSPQQTFSRNRLRGHADHDLPELTFERRIQSMADKPRISDVSIISWFPLCSRSEPQSEAQDDGEECDPDSTATDHGRSLWAGFLVSRTRIYRFSTLVSCARVPLLAHPAVICRKGV